MSPPQVNFTLDGRRVSRDRVPGATLLTVLGGRGEPACTDGTCGRCTVLIDDLPAAACRVLAGQIDGREVEVPGPMPRPRGEPLPIVAVHHPRTLVELKALLPSLDEPWTYVAGGTHLLGGSPPATLVDVSLMAELRPLEAFPAELVLGAGLPFWNLCRQARIVQEFPDLDAACRPRDLAVRHGRGTLGGGLGVGDAALLAPLLARDACAVVWRPDGETETRPVEGLDLRAHELVLTIRLPRRGLDGAFHRVHETGVAAVSRFDAAGRFRDFRLAVGGRRLRDVEAMVDGQPMTTALLRSVSQAVDARVPAVPRPGLWARRAIQDLHERAWT